MYPSGTLNVIFTSIISVSIGMPAKKPKDKILKRGPKPTAQMKEVDKKLKECYFQNGITYSLAAEIAGCGIDHASLMFKKFGDEIAGHKEPDLDWIDKNDRVRDRALEGLALQIKESTEVVKRLKDERKSSKQIQESILPDLTQKIQDTELGQMLEKCDAKTILYLQQILNKDLNLYKNYGYYVLTIEEKIHTKQVFKAELQQQYDSIEILPPPSEVLNAEIERRIAIKQKLKPAIPVMEPPKGKGKK